MEKREEEKCGVTVEMLTIMRRKGGRRHTQNSILTIYTQHYVRASWSKHHIDGQKKTLEGIAPHHKDLSSASLETQRTSSSPPRQP